MGIYYRKNSSVTNLRGRTVTMPADIKRFMDIYDEDNPLNLNYQKGGVHYFIPLIKPALNRLLDSDLAVCVNGVTRYAIDAYARNNLALETQEPRGGEITVYLLVSEVLIYSIYRLYIRCHGYNGKTTIPITVNWTDATGSNRTTTIATDTTINDSVNTALPALYYVAEGESQTSERGDTSKVNIRSVKIGDWNTYTFTADEKLSTTSRIEARHSFSISDLTSFIDK